MQRVAVTIEKAEGTRERRAHFGFAQPALAVARIEPSIELNAEFAGLLTLSLGAPRLGMSREPGCSLRPPAYLEINGD
jgi:hypothetical protein